jgi:hypothetical protein
VYYYIIESSTKVLHMKPYNITAESIKMGEFTINGITLGERGRGRICTIVPTPDQYEYLELGVSKSGRPRLNKSTSSEGWITRMCNNINCRVQTQNTWKQSL